MSKKRLDSIRLGNKQARLQIISGQIKTLEILYDPDLPKEENNNHESLKKLRAEKELLKKEIKELKRG